MIDMVHLMNNLETDEIIQDILTRLDSVNTFNDQLLNFIQKMFLDMDKKLDNIQKRVKILEQESSISTLDSHKSFTVISYKNFKN